MNRPVARQELALEPDFKLGPLDVRPSACRVFSGETEIRVEALTMSALVVLAHAAGATVTREDLVNACWQGRFVSDDAIARTISKVRMVARGIAPLPFILENVPKVGYRLIPVGEGDRTSESLPFPEPSLERPRRLWLSVLLVAVLMLAAFLLGTAFSRRPEPIQSVQAISALPDKPNIHSADVIDAVMSLNGDRLTQYLQAGWKINWPLDTQGGSPLTTLPEVCRRDPNHDQAGVVRMARLLVAAGADPAYGNKWGDTAYVISREGRYCGPHHPVTEYLRSITPGALADPVDKQVGARTP